MIELINSRDSIQKNVITLSTLVQEGVSTADYKLVELKIKISSELNKQLRILESSKKESAILFNYQSEAEILKAQSTFIDIGEKLLVIADEDSSFRDISFRCLMALMKRAELSLAYMGFKRH